MLSLTKKYPVNSVNTMRLLDKEFDIYITAADISRAVKKIAGQIARDYQDLNPLFLAVLNGSIMFGADLIREIPGSLEISFIKLKSYRGTQTTGNIENLIGLQEDIKGRHIIIVEDIVDTGKTLRFTIDSLQMRQPASIAIATLLHKPEVTETQLDIRYCGFKIPNKFVVGYGLDYDGQGRNLKDIYQIKTKI